MTEHAGRVPSVFDLAFLTGREGVTELVLVRHGEQEVRHLAGGPVGDQIDPALSARGREQARLVGERFASEHVDIVYASPLQRALDTGWEIAKHHGLEPIVVEELREVELFRDIPPDQSVRDVIDPRIMAGVRARMIREMCWDVYPLSEPSAEFRKRTITAIEGILAETEGKRVVVACHGGVINAYAGHLIKAPTDMFFRPAHTSVNVILAADGFRAVHALNDCHHLLAGEGLVSF